MEPKQEGEHEKTCCSSGCRCCCAKAIGALILLLLGGLIGYLAGHCGSVKRMCPVMTNPPALSAPAR